MKKIKYEDYLDKRGERVRKSLRIEKKRGISRKPRSGIERKLLLKLDKARFENWKREGKLELIGPRRYKFST